jgi:hypothetical protein
MTIFHKDSAMRDHDEPETPSPERVEDLNPRRPEEHCKACGHRPARSYFLFRVPQEFRQALSLPPDQPWAVSYRLCSRCARDQNAMERVGTHFRGLLEDAVMRKERSMPPPPDMPVIKALRF